MTEAAAAKPKIKEAQKAVIGELSSLADDILELGTTLRDSNTTIETKDTPTPTLSSDPIDSTWQRINAFNQRFVMAVAVAVAVAVAMEVVVSVELR
jgi:hypothetical protein